MTRAFSRHKDSVRSAREPHPISSHRIRLQNARLADRDARCVRLISPAPGLFRDERGERAVDAATEPRRASRDICDREHARASAQLRGISRGTTCMHVYIYIYYLLLSRCGGATPSVAWSKNVVRDHRRRMRAPAAVPRRAPIQARWTGTRLALVSALRKGKESGERQARITSDVDSRRESGETEHLHLHLSLHHRNLRAANSPPATTVTSRDTVG